MSRTYRRKSGHRWWREKQTDWVTEVYVTNKTYTCPYSRKSKFRKEFSHYVVCRGYDKELIARAERDNHDYRSHSGIYKWYVNKSDRSCRRAQLHKILKTENYEDAWYDDSFENTKQRDYLWVVW